jgi:hypothetical protein
MYDESIEVLKELARNNPEKSGEIGYAIGLLSFCKKHNISKTDRVHSLPDTEGAFSYFTVVECNEDGDEVRSVTDESGDILEILPESLILEQV